MGFFTGKKAKPIFLQPTAEMKQAGGYAAGLIGELPEQMAGFREMLAPGLGRMERRYAAGELYSPEQLAAQRRMGELTGMGWEELIGEAPEVAAKRQEALDIMERQMPTTLARSMAESLGGYATAGRGQRIAAQEAAGRALDVQKQRAEIEEWLSGQKAGAQRTAAEIGLRAAPTYASMTDILGREAQIGQLMAALQGLPMEQQLRAMQVLAPLTKLTQQEFVGMQPGRPGLGASLLPAIGSILGGPVGGAIGGGFSSLLGGGGGSAAGEVDYDYIKQLMGAGAFGPRG